MSIISNKWIAFIMVLSALTVTPATVFAEYDRPAPVITHTAVDYSSMTIYVYGSDFGTRKPIVKLGDTQLVPLSWHPEWITAQLPSDIVPGSYSLTLFCTFRHHHKMIEASLSVAIGAEGPQGEPGSQGPAGLTGPAGPQGPAGPPGPIGLAGAVGAQGPAGAPGPVGPIGPQGPQGLIGPTGPAGPQGPAGPTGTGGSVDPTKFHSVKCTNRTSCGCPAGEVLISGGAQCPLEGSTPSLVSSYPAPTPTATLWLASCGGFDNVNGGFIMGSPSNITIICLSR